MLRQVNQLGQGAPCFPEKKPETTIFLGKKKQDILNVVFVEARICHSSIELKQKLYCTRLSCIGRIKELKTSTRGM